MRSSVFESTYKRIAHTAEKKKKQKLSAYELMSQVHFK